MTEEGNQDDLFKKLEEINKKSQETHQRRQRANRFKSFEGEPAISENLKKAIATLVKQEYRGVECWSAVLVYRFHEDKIQLKISVRADDGLYGIEFSEFEAIAIAEKLDLNEDQGEQQR